MIDPDLRQRARELAQQLRHAPLNSAAVVDQNAEVIEAALRAVQQETEQRMKVQRAQSWDETAKRIEAIDTLTEERDALRIRCATIQEEVARLDALINNPHTEDFLESVRLEAAHQRERWAADGDAGKADADWFWLIGYLAGKAISKPEKLLHHIITTAAACLNWHAHRSGASTAMRPGSKTQLDIALKEEREGRS